MTFTILKISTDKDKDGNEEFNDQTTLVSAQNTLNSSSDPSPLTTQPAFSYKAFFSRPRVICGLFFILAGLSFLIVCLYPFTESSRKRMDLVLKDIYDNASYEANRQNLGYEIAVLRTGHTATGCVHRQKQISCTLVEAYRGSCWNPWGTFNVDIYYGVKDKLDCQIVRTGDGGFINWYWGNFNYTSFQAPEGAKITIDGPRWPEGPWQDSCEKVFYHEFWSELSTVCKDESGIKHNSTFDIRPCSRGPLFNYNGQIACSASGPPVPSWPGQWTPLEGFRDVVFPDL